MKLLKWLFALVLLGAALAGCQSGVQPTPTPFPTPPPVSSVLPAVPEGAAGIPVNVTDLLANPEFFADALIQVTGVYGRLPLLVCGYDPQLSPATWTLTAGEEVALAGGFDAPLRELFPTGLTMTVAGYWRHWQGPVGCGKQATPQEFWYLEVTRLVSPSQLVRVTLTPASGPAEPPGALAESPTPSFEPLPEETRTEVPPTEERETLPPTATIDFTLPLTPSPAGYPPAEEEPTRGTAVITGTPATPATPATLATSQTPLGTPTASPTLPPGTTATPTVPVQITPGSPTATSGGAVVDRGDIEYFDAFFDQLNAAQLHNWHTEVEVSEPITASVIGEPQLNVGLRLLSPQGVILTDRNSVPAGGVESISLPVTSAGEYILQVYETSGQGGRYFISLWDEIGDYRPMGTLQTGVQRSATITQIMVHVWFFQGSAGQTVTIQTAAPSGSDLLLSLYDPTEELLTYQSGLIGQFVLPESGWYKLEVEEFNREQTTYQMTMTLQ